jgi:hypothetical protein
MPIPNQGSCQSRKTAENCIEATELGDFANQELVGFTKARVGTFAAPDASNAAASGRMVSVCWVSLPGAWLGGKVAGPKSGAKGAMLGYGAAAIARRSVPALAAIALGGWAFKQLRDRRNRRSPSYPSEAAPSSPAD